MMKKYECVMIIDDSEIDRWLALKIMELTAISFLTLSATNGMDALKEVENYFLETGKLPEVILVDLQMPVMNGFHFIQKMKEHPDFSETSTRLVLLTAGLDDSDIIQIGALGIKNVLIKPLDKNELNYILQN